MTRSRRRPEHASYLRQMAHRQRELAEEFERQADMVERRCGLPAVEADRGHTWRISVEDRESSKVVGDEHHTDALEFTPLPAAVEVRAWNLRDALAKASLLPLTEWFPEEEQL